MAQAVASKASAGSLVPKNIQVNTARKDTLHSGPFKAVRKMIAAVDRVDTKQIRAVQIVVVGSTWQRGRLGMNIGPLPL